MKVVVLFLLLTLVVSGITQTEGPLHHVQQLVQLGKSLTDLEGTHLGQHEENIGTPFAFDYGYLVLSTCKAFLEEYAKQSSNFTMCLIKYARPFRFCETCAQPYKKASSLFSDMLGDSACSKELLMADRVQVVRLVNTNMEQIWQGANCPDCFESITEDTNGTVNISLTNNTNLFIDLFNNMTDCLNQTMQGLESEREVGNTSVCETCRTEYRSLNSHFNSMLDRTSTGVCMDIVDMMNYTRLKWSKDLHCSHRQGEIGPVLAITALICSLPVIFYVANRICRPRSEKRTILIQRRMKFPQVGSGYGSMNGNRPTLQDSHSRSNSFRSNT